MHRARSTELYYEYDTRLIHKKWYGTVAASAPSFQAQLPAAAVVQYPVPAHASSHPAQCHGSISIRCTLTPCAPSSCERAKVGWTKCARFATGGVLRGVIFGCTRSPPLLHQPYPVSCCPTPRWHCAAANGRLLVYRLLRCNVSRLLNLPSLPCHHRGTTVAKLPSATSPSTSRRAHTKPRQINVILSGTGAQLSPKKAANLKNQLKEQGRRQDAANRKLGEDAAEHAARGADIDAQIEVIRGNHRKSPMGSPIRPRSGRSLPSSAAGPNLPNRRLQELSNLVLALQEAPGTPGADPSSVPARWLADAIVSGETRLGGNALRVVLSAVDLAGDPDKPGRVDNAQFLQLCRAELDGLLSSETETSESESGREHPRIRERPKSAGTVLSTARTRLAPKKQRPHSAAAGGAQHTNKDWALRASSTMHKASSMDRLSMYHPGSMLETAAPSRGMPRHAARNWVDPRSKTVTYRALFTVQYKGLKTKVRPRFRFLQHRPEAATLTVFDGHLSPGEVFTLELCRSANDPLGLTVFKNEVLFEQYSACCEHKYTPGATLGGTSGTFTVVGCTGDNPCVHCKVHIPQRPSSAAAGMFALYDEDDTAHGREHYSSMSESDTVPAPERRKKTSTRSETPKTPSPTKAKKRRPKSAGRQRGVPSLSKPGTPTPSSPEIKSPSPKKDKESFDDMWARLNHAENNPRADPSNVNKNSMYAWGNKNRNELNQIIEDGEEWTGFESEDSPEPESREDMLRRSFSEARRQSVEYALSASESSDSDTTEAQSTLASEAEDSYVTVDTAPAPLPAPVLALGVAPKGLSALFRNVSVGDDPNETRLLSPTRPSTAERRSPLARQASTAAEVQEEAAAVPPSPDEAPPKPPHLMSGGKTMTRRLSGPIKTVNSDPKASIARASERPSPSNAMVIEEEEEPEEEEPLIATTIIEDEEAEHDGGPHAEEPYNPRTPAQYMAGDREEINLDDGVPGVEAEEDLDDIDNPDLDPEINLHEEFKSVVPDDLTPMSIIGDVDNSHTEEDAARVPRADSVVEGDPAMDLLLTKLRHDVESRIQQALAEGTVEEPGGLELPRLVGASSVSPAPDDDEFRANVPPLKSLQLSPNHIDSFLSDLSSDEEDTTGSQPTSPRVDHSARPPPDSPDSVVKEAIWGERYG